MSRLPKNPDPFNLKGCFLAGGSILSIATKANIADYDYYPKSKEELLDAIHTLIDDSNCFLVNISDRALTFKSNDVLADDDTRTIVQLMTYRYFDTAHDIFENFDFSICMGAFDCDKEEYIFHDDFFPDIASKTLRFNHKTLYPLNSLLRISKYREKGYFISKPESTKLALTIGKVGLPNSWEELEHQIGGNYGKELELERKDLEYSYNNAIDILSEMVFDFTYYEKINENEELFSLIKPDFFENYVFNDKTIRYIKQDNEYIILDENNFIVDTITKDLEEHFNVIKDKGQEVSSGRIYGYKKLKDNGDGTYISIMAPLKSKVIYKIGEETEEFPMNKSLFVWSRIKQFLLPHENKNEVYNFLVSFNIEDIYRFHQGISEIKCKKLKVEKKLEEGIK